MEIKQRPLSTIEQLDKILNYSYDNNLMFTEYDIKKYFENDKEMSLLGIGDIKLILDKLANDSYIDNKTYGTDRQYRITWNGKYFKENGGYIQQRKDIKAKKYRENLLNVIMSLGTGFAGLYGLIYLLKLLYPVWYLLFSHLY